MRRLAALLQRVARKPMGNLKYGGLTVYAENSVTCGTTETDLSSMTHTVVAGRPRTFLVLFSARATNGYTTGNYPWPLYFYLYVGGVSTETWERTQRNSLPQYDDRRPTCSFHSLVTVPEGSTVVKIRWRCGTGGSASGVCTRRRLTLVEVL